MIDSILWKIEKSIRNKTHNTLTSEKAITPLLWYINTGRSSYQFEQALQACSAYKVGKIADILIKDCMGDYSLIIDKIKSYIEK